ncbi:glycosyltransferase family 4 protein [Algoriphagus aquimarinus]|uniref:glycosyltransferase family 4 protein n=1 Tax=Algoriphagus aquimarinus TaxID=237018 RepID=UPI0030DDD35B
MKIFAYNDFILKKNKDKIYADDSHILFIKATCETYFDEFQLGSRCIETDEPGHYFFTDKKEEVLVFPFYSSVSQFFKKPSLLSRSKALLKSAVGHYDVFWLTWPHPISFLVLMLVGRKKPVVLFVRQNLEALIHVRYSGINRFVGKKFTQFLYTYARLFHKNALIVSVGDEMYNYFKPVYKNNFYVSDSIVSEKLQLPARKEFNKDVKLLFVGRLEPEKGLFDLVNAVKLVNESIPVSLTIVGEGGVGEELRAFVEELNVSHCVKFAGYQAFGESLFELYRSHDIMVISSYSEGLPKIINEARAFAMPIVSTKVGGIAKELQEGETCLFVPPGKPELLAAAVVFLLHNPKVYQRISQNLHDQFSSNSLEYWSGRFAALVKDYASKNF